MLACRSATSSQLQLCAYSRTRLLISSQCEGAAISASRAASACCALCAGSRSSARDGVVAGPMRERTGRPLSHAAGRLPLACAVRKRKICREASIEVLRDLGEGEIVRPAHRGRALLEKPAGVVGVAAGNAADNVESIRPGLLLTQLSQGEERFQSFFRANLSEVGDGKVALLRPGMGRDLAEDGITRLRRAAPAKKAVVIALLELAAEEDSVGAGAEEMSGETLRQFERGVLVQGGGGCRSEAQQSDEMGYEGEPEAGGWVLDVQNVVAADADGAQQTPHITPSPRRRGEHVGRDAERLQGGC